MHIPLWVERNSEMLMTTTNLPKTFIFVAEPKDKFSLAHQEQLEKILAYLGFNHFELIYSGDPLPKTEADIIVSFGVKYLPKFATAPCITLSISDMLSNPPCKRQVLNDLKALKALKAD